MRKKMGKQVKKVIKIITIIFWVFIIGSVFGFFAQLLPEFKRRNQLKNQLLDEDLEEEETL